MTIGADMSFDPSLTRLRKKANKQLKQTTAEQLEQETKRMEERIRALKHQMVKEKEEREKFGGSRWMSGKSGPVLSHQASKKKPIKAEKGPRKIRLLSDQPLSSYAKKTALRESLNESFGSDMICGQCEKTKATLACMDCTENYCVGCFMGFHRKGALRNHTTQNLDQIGCSLAEERDKPTNRTDQRPKVAVPGQLQNGTYPEMTTGGSLLQGVYDEKESSESFAQALKEWRNIKGKENSWVNPADRVSTVSCETSTNQEKPQPINLNFGSNKSMSYLDRLVLKKHRDFEPPNRTPRREERKIMNHDEKPHFEAVNDDFGVNYREIFQTIGVHSARAKSTPCQNYFGRSSVTIEEVLGPNTNTEETTVCFIEEGSNNTSDTTPLAPKRAAQSRGGRVSILGMTPFGDFSEVPSRPSRVSLDAVSSQSRKSPLDRVKLVSNSVSSRVWSPKPTYTGLSDFFLAGVKSPSINNTAKVEDNHVASTSIISKLLSKGVWKPSDSVSIEVVNHDEQPKEDNGGPFPVIPLVQEPPFKRIVQHNNSTKSDSTEKGNSYDSEVNNMQDFGINDFLKAGPVPRKLSVDYNDVHRVSTVSPLTLSPRPPQLHWSDDDSDDDVIVDVVSRAPEMPKGFHSKEEQDEEDQATLEDLAWELASTTGRLTHCEGELDDSLDNVLEEHVENNNHSGDEDSIEEDNGGISLDEDSNDELDEDQLHDSTMKEEVHALE